MRGDEEALVDDFDEQRQLRRLQKGCDIGCDAWLANQSSRFEFGRFDAIARSEPGELDSKSRSIGAADAGKRENLLSAEIERRTGQGGVTTITALIKIEAFDQPGTTLL